MANDLLHDETINEIQIWPMAARDNHRMTVSDRTWNSSTYEDAFIVCLR